MHVTLEYTEEIKTPFSEKFFQTIAKQTLEKCEFSFLEGKEISLNVISISAEKIQELNTTYRGKESVTDVLSFGEYANKETLSEAEGKKIFLGEIFFCPAFIENAAKEDTVTFEREMVYIFSHGVLHLVGFDHEEEMFTIQEEVTDVFTAKKEYTE
ncbi:MAG: rRNA maturation RNase YbeY [Candidatus Moraniibacteriota bacterium]